MNRSSEINANGREVQAAVELQPIALRSMFWRPAWLAASAWQEHIPFAFWLIDAHRPKVVVELGTHNGTSYFALCQAVDRLGLDSRCFAVDTWKGDEHAGHYDESVFDAVRTYNDAQYSGFSRLVRSTFDDALQHFSDGSIDLLHIDGLHTVEAVTHDFESWLPKLSDRAVVIFHDTNVRERGFGVYRLFERLKLQYPAFEFVHGHGLGVLAIGEHQSPLLKRLFDSAGRNEEQHSIREVFSRLGRSCADAFATQQQKTQLCQLSSDLQDSKKRLDEVSKMLVQSRGKLESKTVELATFHERQGHQVERHALERGQLAERVSMLLEVKAELKEQLSRLQSQIDAVRGDPPAADDKQHHARERDAALARLQAAEAALADAGTDSAREHAERDDLLNAHAQAMDALNAQLDSTKALHAEMLEKHRHDIEALSEAKRRAEASVQARFAETAQLTRQLIEHQQLLSDRDAAAKTLQKQLAGKADAGRRLQEQLDNAIETLADTSAELVSARKALQASREAADQLRAELHAVETSRSWKLTAPLRRARPGANRSPLTAEPETSATAEPDQHAQDIRLIRESVLLDSAWYMQRYPDVAQAGLDPGEHFLLHGASELRDPGPSFSTSGYLKSYPDVAEAGLNPLVHYLAFGRAEGRVAPPSE